MNGCLSKAKYPLKKCLLDKLVVFITLIKCALSFLTTVWITDLGRCKEPEISSWIFSSFSPRGTKCAKYFSLWVTFIMVTNRGVVTADIKAFAVLHTGKLWTLKESGTSFVFFAHILKHRHVC